MSQLEQLVGEQLVQAEEDDYEAIRRRWWVRSINQNRTFHGTVHKSVLEMRAEDDESFFNFSRMSIKHFDHLLQLVLALAYKIFLCVRV